jgi:hypothetical protein
MYALFFENPSIISTFYEDSITSYEFLIKVEFFWLFENDHLLTKLGNSDQFCITGGERG